MAEKKDVPAVAPKTDVVDWQSQLGALTLATAEAEKPSGNWMSFQAGRLKVNGQYMKEDKVRGAVAYAIFENQIYKGKYDSDNPTSPYCFAFAENEDDLKPHPNSLSPQAESCAVCPNNAWGSDPEGGRGKACKNVRRLAWIHESDLVPDKVEKAEVVLSKLPVTSGRNWSTYASQLANVLKLPPLAVVTEMSVVPNPKTIFQVEFQLVDKINDNTVIQKLLARRKDIQPIIFAPYDKPIEPPVRPDPTPKKFDK